MTEVIIQGEPGAGKTFSLRNLPPSSVLLTPNMKALPWKGGMAPGGLWSRKKQVSDLNDLPGLIKQFALKTEKRPGLKYIIVDDFFHVLNLRTLSQQFHLQGQNEKNKYARYEQLGRDLFAAIVQVVNELNLNHADEVKDTVLVIINHTATTNEGKKEFKNQGRMLGNTIDPTSYCTVVYHSIVVPGKEKPEDRYVFLTNDNGVYEAKSPAGMHPSLQMPNDLYLLLLQMEAYFKDQPMPLELPKATA